MQIKRTFRYRLYPTNRQKDSIDDQLELCRRLYNHLLGTKRETFLHGNESLSKFDLNNCISYFNESNPDFALVHSQVKQNISDRVSKAFNNMFARIKRGEKNTGYPRFKGKGRYRSICYPQSGFSLVSEKKLKVSKIGDINIKLHRSVEGHIKTLTINRTATDKYYVTLSCIVDIDQPKAVKEVKAVGIDVGLKHYLTTSDGHNIVNPKFFRKSEDKLARIQRRHSKRKLKSNNRNKSRLKVALCHERIKFQRIDFLHKLSHDIVNKYDMIGIENLNIKGMVQNNHLSKSISDAGWGIFTEQLCYKAEYAGGVVKESDRFFPSSRLCNNCGNKQDMPLYRRTFRCNVCGYVEDRDINAAKNLLGSMLSDTEGTSGINACGDVEEQVISRTMSKNQEAAIFK